MPLDQWHHQVIAPLLVKEIGGADDLRVMKAGLSLGFPDEPGFERRVVAQILGHDFDGDMFVQHLVARAPDLAHTALADLFFKHVISNDESSLHFSLLLSRLVPRSLFAS